ncbi:MAG TPA: ectonucleotide pyrophosphatase/phosphodiesterase [Rhizomicrobium sp.]|nr:ectonucleotide pyrophosphatase/phosphodiesterase [Rhizomicrobium sp.]
MKTSFAFAVALLAATPAYAHPVLMVSIDGLRPGDVLEAKARGMTLPHFSEFTARGAYATGVRNVLPTVTYPDHTTLITGVWPSMHGIAANTTFDPLRKNYEGWYWYFSDIKVPTLWNAVKDSGGNVASVSWPVSVGAPVDENVPEYWRANTDDDVKLQRVLASPGLAARLERETGIGLADATKESPEGDTAKAKYAARIVADFKPEFFTVHLNGVDGRQHQFGPGSAEAHAAIENADAALGIMEDAERAVHPDIVIALVSDHGFAPVSHEVHITNAFVEAGLVKLDDKKRIVGWDAMPWNTGASSAIMLARPDDAALKTRVKALLDQLAADPNNGIARVADQAEIARLGGARGPSFWVDYKIGYLPGGALNGPMITDSSVKGTHGYFPEHPEMHSTFLIEGPGIPAGKNLGEIDMRDIAPTLARAMNVGFPSATGKPLF